ncbi:helix-turn-helix domain-containing protein [bacterium]|nr:helix-turn-helix domain-containing protein [bacterium]
MQQKLELEFSNKVEYYRVLLGMTKAELSRRSGVSLYVIWKIEKTNKTTRRISKTRIANALGIDALELFPEDRQLELIFGVKNESS